MGRVEDTHLWLARKSERKEIGLGEMFAGVNELRRVSMEERLGIKKIGIGNKMTVAGQGSEFVELRLTLDVTLIV